MLSVCADKQRSTRFNALDTPPRQRAVRAPGGRVPGNFIIIVIIIISLTSALLLAQQLNPCSQQHRTVRL